MKKEKNLAITYPDIAKQWHPTKNGDLKPSDVMPSSTKVVWWLCPNNHETHGSVKNKVENLSCKKCNTERGTSFPETVIYYYIKRIFPDAIHFYKDLGFELDIYIPSRKIAIEYDGYYFHKNKVKLDIWKNQQCKEKNITLYRLRENLPSLNFYSIDIQCDKKQKYLTSAIEILINKICNEKIKIDILSDLHEIYELMQFEYKEISLESKFPDIAKEWHPTKNGNLKPSQVVAGSEKKVWWLGKCGHEWIASVNHRTKGHGCLYCTGQKVLAGFNDLATKNPELAKEWHPTKNGDLKPTDVTVSSSKYAWWQCEHGHEWYALIANRNKGRKCPVCSNALTVTGINDFATKQPELLAEWHPVKNSGIDPTKLSACSNKKVWWLGKCGHEWEATIGSRIRGTSCPICSNKKVLIGYNDLATTHPEVAKEWHPTKNGDLKPTDVTAGSNKEVWWMCNEKHEYKATVVSRKQGSACPVCCRKIIAKGHNDLATTYPEIAKQWHPTKNGNLTPSDVLGGGHKTFWWQCEHGHEWQKRVYYMLQNPECPYCANKMLLKGFNDLESKYPELLNDWNYEKNLTLPSEILCSAKEKFWWKCKDGHDYKMNIHDKLSLNGCCPKCLSMKKQYNRLFHEVSPQKPNNFSESLAGVFPELVKQWHPTKNSDLKPTDIMSRSQVSVWWKCEEGHEWKASVWSRTKGNHIRKCPICCSVKVVEGVNDIRTTHPHIVKFWHPIKNEIDISKISAKCTLKMWFICEHGHEFLMPVNKFVSSIECPYCANKLLLVGFNDLATKNPELAKEWHPTKNGDLKPTDVMPNNTKKVWWVGKCGHEWDAKVSDRTNGRNCPICANKRILIGYNDIATTHPEIAKQWHPTKNGDLKPTNIVANSHQKIWWQCEKGHEWIASPNNRTKNQGCPICGNKKVLIGYNDLATTHPEIAKQWHPTKNGDLKPTDFVAGNETSVWWICEHGHEWKTPIKNRKRGSGCLYCSNQKVLAGFNDLATTHPQIAAEWDYSKNGDIKPTDVIAGGHTKFWWKCECGHSWKSDIGARKQGHNCPICSKKKVLSCLL